MPTPRRRPARPGDHRRQRPDPAARPRRPAHAPARAGPRGRRDGPLRHPRRGDGRLHRGARDGEHDADAGHRGRRRAGLAARSRRRLGRRPPGRRRHGRPRGRAAGRAGRDGRVRRAGAGVLRRRQVRARPGASCAARSSTSRRSTASSPSTRRSRGSPRAPRCTRASSPPSSGWPAGPRSRRRRSSRATCCSPSTSARACTSATCPPPGSVEIIRWAKSRGIDVTAEVTPHHLILTDELARGYDPVFKVNPPLRTQRDVEAVREGLADGTIDIVATDHAPHTREDKDCEWGAAAFGMTGLETALSVVQETMVDTGRMTWADVARVHVDDARPDRPRRRPRPPDRRGGARQPHARRPGHPPRRRARGAGHARASTRRSAAASCRAASSRPGCAAARPSWTGRRATRAWWSAREPPGRLDRSSWSLVVLLVVLRHARRLAGTDPTVGRAASRRCRPRPAELGAQRLGPVGRRLRLDHAGGGLARPGHRPGPRRAQPRAGRRVRRRRPRSPAQARPTCSCRPRRSAARPARPGMAGKVVGGDGLVVLTWQADPADPRGLDTGLRPAARRRPRAARRRDRPTHPSDPGATAPAQEENS